MHHTSFLNARENQGVVEQGLTLTKVKAFQKTPHKAYQTQKEYP